MRYSTKVRYRTTVAMSNPNTQCRPATSFEANSYTSEALMARIPTAIVHPIVLVIQWLTKAAPMIRSDDVIASTCNCIFGIRPNTLDFDMRCATGQELCLCAMHYCSTRTHTTCLHTYIPASPLLQQANQTHMGMQSSVQHGSPTGIRSGPRANGQRAASPVRGQRAEGSLTDMRQRAVLPV